MRYEIYEIKEWLICWIYGIIIWIICFMFVITLCGLVLYLIGKK
jgi:hypothetical protein